MAEETSTSAALPIGITVVPSSLSSSSTSSKVSAKSSTYPAGRSVSFRVDDGLHEDEEAKDTSAGLREQRAMLDVDLRLLIAGSKSIHAKHQLHVTPHYSRSLHSNLMDEDGALPPSSAAFKVNTVGNVRDKDKPIDSLPLITQLDTEESVRTRVHNRMEEIVHVQQEPQLHFALDTFISECAAAGTLRNDCWSTLQLLLSYHSHYLSSLEALNYHIVNRFFQRMNSNAILERYGPRFSAILVAIFNQYEKTLNRYEVLKATYQANITVDPASLDEQQQHKPGGPTTPHSRQPSQSPSHKRDPSVASNASVGTSSPSPTPHFAGGITPPLTQKKAGWEKAMTKADLEDYARYSIPRVATRQRMSRFLMKLRWIHSLAEREIIDVSSHGLWNRNKDLTVPPNYSEPLLTDMLPSNLVSVEEVDAENRRLERLWKTETSLNSGSEVDEAHGLRVADEEIAGERNEHAANLNPFGENFELDNWTTHSNGAGMAFVDLFPSSSSALCTSSRTDAPPSIFDSISRTFSRVFRAQAHRFSPNSFTDYAILLDQSDTIDAVQLDIEYATLTEEQITALRAARLKKVQEEKRAEALKARAEAAAAFASNSVLKPDQAAPNRILRPTGGPVLSASGKIWGGNALNNFAMTAADEREADVTATMDGDAIRGRKTSANSSAGAALVARLTEEESGRVPEQPLKGFRFSNQKQADLFSDPARMIDATGRGSGGLDKKFRGPKTYLRRANFLRQTRLYPNIPDYLVQQKQILADFVATGAIDTQLKNHYRFVVRNDAIEVCQREIVRLVSEHLSLMQLEGMEKPPAAAAAKPNFFDKKPAKDEPKATRHMRKTSLAIMDEVKAGSQSSSSVPTNAPAADAAASGNAPSSSPAAPKNDHIEKEIPQHKLQALYMLRVLRVRELRARILGVLNYFRSMQKVLVKDEAMYEDEVDHSGSKNQSTSKPTAPSSTLPSFAPSSASSAPFSNSSFTPAVSRLYNPQDIISRSSNCQSLEDRCDEWSFDGSTACPVEHIVVRDARKKVRIVYDAAVNDLEELETELLALASIYIERHQYVGLGMKGEVDHELAAYQSLLQSLDGGISGSGPRMPTRNTASDVASNANRHNNDKEGDSYYPPDSLLLSSKTAKFEDSADRWSVLIDLFEKEYAFLKSKRLLMDVYFESYSHCLEKEKMRGIAQKIIELMNYRPHFDLDRSVNSFGPIYTAETQFLSSQASLYREIMYTQLEEEMMHGTAVGVNSMLNATGGLGTTNSSSSSAHATFDWTLFSREYSNTEFDACNFLGSLQLTPALPHPLQHAHTLFEFHPSFDCINDVAQKFDEAVARIETSLPVAKKKVLNIYLMQIRQKVVENALHLFRSHIHEDAPFPPSQHFTTLDFFETSPFFSNASYALVKLAANFHTQREQMTGSNRRVPQLDQVGNVVDGAELQLYLNYIELFNVRQSLLATMYESMILTRVYFQQAERLGVESPRTMLDMHTSFSSSASQVNANSNQPKISSTFAAAAASSYLLSSGTSEIGTFAVSEVFALLPKDLFKRLTEIERLEIMMDTSLLQNMRSTLEVQRMQLFTLEIVLTVHTALSLAEEMDDTARKGMLASLPPHLQSLVRKPSTKGALNPSTAASSIPSSFGGGRAVKNPFAKMIAQIEAANKSPNATSPATSPRNKSKRASTTLSGLMNKPRASPRHRHETRGALTAECFISIFQAKLVARDRTDQYLAEPADTSLLASNHLSRHRNHAHNHGVHQTHTGHGAHRGRVGSALHVSLKPTNSVILSPSEQVHHYCVEVLRALTPEIYVAEIVSFRNEMRELHAGSFGTFSPFMSVKFKLFGSDSYLDHLVWKQPPPVEKAESKSPPAATRDLGLGSGPPSPNNAAVNSTAAASPAPAPASAVPDGAIILPDGSVMQPAHLRFGSTNAGAIVAAPGYGSLFQIPQMNGLIALLAFDRSEVPLENLRLDALCRKSLLDGAMLNTSLAQLEFLPTLSFSSNKVAELTSSRLDFIRNELREIGPRDSSPDSFHDVFAMIHAERKTTWLRLLVFMRFLTENLLVREDLLGLEYVQKVVRLVRNVRNDPTRLREGVGGMVAAPLVPRYAPFEGGAAAVAGFDPFVHPVTSLHRLASFFLYWCDRRIVGCFEGLVREQAAMAKLVYRMGKDNVNSVLAAAAAAAAGVVVEKTPYSVETRARAERTATTMAGALSLTQMFDAFYQYSLEREAAAKSNANTKPSTAFTLPLPKQSTWSFASRASFANAHVDMFSDGQEYLRVLEAADVNLIARLNDLRRKEMSRTRGVAAPMPMLAILERTPNQVTALMAASVSPNAPSPTSLVLSDELNDILGGIGHGPLLPNMPSTALAAGALNSAPVFGFTLFALGLRILDQEILMGFLRDQFQFDLLSQFVASAKNRLEVLKNEEAIRHNLGEYAADAKYVSLLQSTRLLINEVQDASYEMNVIKEWLAGGANSSSVGDGSSMVNQRNKVYYVLQKENFNMHLSQLMREILQFGDETRRFRLHCVKGLNDFLERNSKQKALVGQNLTKQVEAQVAEFTAQSLAQVTDAQYGLIIELQSLREQMDLLKSNSTDQENQLRATIEQEYEAKVHRLSMEILRLHSQLDINNLSIRQRILTHYYELKKNTLEEMIKNGSAPYLIKKRALKILNAEAKFQDTKNEYYALNATFLKLSTLFDMKSLLQQRLFSKEDQLMGTQLNSHDLLLKEIASCEQRSIVWKSELQETKNSLMMCHKYLEELQKNFLHYRRENARLNQWKKNQLFKLAKLEVIVQQFEDVSELDFEKLEQELRQKAEEMETALEYEKNADLRQQLMEASHEKKLRQIRRLLQREERLITEAHAKIHELSISDGPAINALNPSLDQQNDKVWEHRAVAAQSKVDALRAENARLREQLSGEVVSAATWNQQQKANAIADPAHHRTVTPKPDNHKLPPQQQWKR